MAGIDDKFLTRRNLLRGASAGLFGAAGAAVLAACGEAQVVERIVTHEVTKEVPVETVVIEEVVKEVPVEIVVTKEVVQEVAVERVVTAEIVIHVGFSPRESIPPGGSAQR